MKYFTRNEFACKCGCGLDTVDYELVMVLEELREHFQLPVLITSGCRCFLKNRSVGGSQDSLHIIGRAADIKVKGVDAHVVADYLKTKYPEQFGIGTYDTWTHIDTRDKKARWPR